MPYLGLSSRWPRLNSRSHCEVRARASNPSTHTQVFCLHMFYMCRASKKHQREHTCEGRAGQPGGEVRPAAHRGDQQGSGRGNRSVVRCRVVPFGTFVLANPLDDCDLALSSAEAECVAAGLRDMFPPPSRCTRLRRSRPRYQSRWHPSSRRPAQLPGCCSSRLDDTRLRCLNRGSNKS